MIVSYNKEEDVYEIGLTFWEHNGLAQSRYGGGNSKLVKGITEINGRKIDGLILRHEPFVVGQQEILWVTNGGYLEVYIEFNTLIVVLNAIAGVTNHPCRTDMVRNFNGRSCSGLLVRNVKTEKRENYGN